MLIGIFYSQIVESSSLVSVLFREVFSHPYVSFFHLLVNGFSVIYICMCVCTYHTSHPPVKSGSQRKINMISFCLLPYNLIIEASSLFAGLKYPPCQRMCMHRTSEVLLPFCVTNLCSFQYVPVVCACLLVKYVDFFYNLMQFHQFIWG